MQPQRLADLACDGVQRIQGRHGFLENHADAVATDPAHLAFTAADQFGTIETDAAGDMRTRRQQAHQRLHRDGFAAARFTHDAHRFTALQREADAAHRVGRATLSLQADMEVVDF